MARQFVYLLFDYDEHGPERIGATLDRSKLPALLVKLFSKTNVPHYDDPEEIARERERQEQVIAAELPKVLAALASLLEHSDEDLASGRVHPLAEGWGGFMLQALPLD